MQQFKAVLTSMAIKNCWLLLKHCFL